MRPSRFAHIYGPPTSSGRAKPKKTLSSRITPAALPLLGVFLSTTLACSQGAAPKPATPNPTNSSGAAKTTSSTSKQDSTSGSPSGAPSEKGQPEQLACEDLPLHTRCVTPSPLGWHGPILPQAAQDSDSFGECASPFPGDQKNSYLSKVRPEQSTCEGCEVELELGTCSPPALALRSVKVDAPSKCEGFLDKTKTTPVQDQCLAISKEGARSGETAVGVLPGTPNLDQADCKVTKQAELDQGDIEIVEKHRICAGKVEAKGYCPNQRNCMAFNIGRSKEKGKAAPILQKVCIYKEGDHSCPKENYLEKVLIHQGIEDKRSCAPCQAKHTKGELQCSHALGLSSRDQATNCPDPSPLDPEDLCLTEEDFLGRMAPWSIFAVRSEVQYSGRCEAVDPEVVGQVEFTGTVTLCCQETLK